MTSTYPDPVAACIALIGVGAPAAWTFKGIHQSSTATTKYCIYNHTNTVSYPDGYWSFHNLQVILVGDSCPVGQTYNSDTSRCEGDPCKDKEGDSQRVSKSGIKNDDFLTVIYNAALKRNFYIHKPVACFDGCAVDVSDLLKCVTDTAGQYHCAGTGTYNGTSCSSQHPSSDPDPDGNDPIPQTKTDEENCVYGSIGEGVMACHSLKRIDSEGIFGDQPGVCSTPEGCSGKDPKKDETRIDTEVKTEPLPNGGTKTTKTDTKTVTICWASDTNCTVRSTTKTTTTTTNGNGVPTGTTGTCKGDDCPSNTYPDADGDGWGDCSGDDCSDGDDDGGPSVGGEDCGVPLVCEGDAIQCAILRQEKENNCKWALGETEQAQVVANVSGEGFELEEKSFSASGLFSEALNQGRWLGSSCPPPRTLSVMGRTITFSWEPVCEFAIALAPIIVAMASLFFALFVFRGIKGS